MDIAEAFKIFDRYDLKERAQNECMRRKIAKAPYDMKGHYEVFCDLLNEVLREIRNKKLEVQNKCNDSDEINTMNKEMEEIAQAIQTLKNTAEEDYWLN